jgi:hypothetical protein
MSSLAIWIIGDDALTSARSEFTNSCVPRYRRDMGELRLRRGDRCRFWGALQAAGESVPMRAAKRR